MTVVSATAPCRVDLAGGTLDLWPTCQLIPDAVTVNAAIDVLAGCTIEPGGSSWRFVAGDGGEELELSALPPRPESVVPPAFSLAACVMSAFDLPPCRVETFSAAPRGSGLGGSSALIVALIAASAELAGSRLGERALLDLAANLETRILKLPAGTQDHVSAWHGGLSLIEHGAMGWERSALPAAADLLSERLIVADSRVPHHSGMSNWGVLRAFLDGDEPTRAALEGVAAAARRMRDAFCSSPLRDDVLEQACEAMAEDWAARSRLGEGVTTPELETLVSAVKGAGGSAKVCGAGGGGCIVALPEREQDRDSVLAALESTGAVVMETKLVSEGVKVVRS